MYKRGTSQIIIRSFIFPQRMGRSCRQKLPFFINSARLRTAESYFKQNYSPDLYRLSIESNRRDSSTCVNRAWTCSIPEEDEENSISLRNDDDAQYDTNNNVKANEDDEVQFTGLGFIWTTLQKLTFAFRYMIGKNSEL